MMKKSKSFLALLLGVGIAGHSLAQQSLVERQQFVDIKSVIENVEYDIRYATSNNFVGERIDGYLASKCLIHRDAMSSLRDIVNELAKQDLRLKFFDCYRPEKAVAHFMSWANDLSDTKTKADYYPNLDKSALVGPYIAERSGHSRGFTVDLTLVRKDGSGQYVELDMGSSYDLFDPLSNTDNPGINASQRKNRQLLKTVMESHGFAAYNMEWWHFTYRDMTTQQKQQYYDFDVN
ncbi:M15 family metallopeptidase [Thalassotalea mangrovi]|uniref:D-alanyl-D-alanine dipeptidase n=1 Tax=Thalassotalea mangrovi TaxID=2572245 RepID=A0A4U1B2W1_9GAMM|nr:M15 family metallopeptidase [Thalassotalea mangrovi]TKB43535.1 peptidase M15 [Thalassotalea mangrovi]